MIGRNVLISGSSLGWRECETWTELSLEAQSAEMFTFHAGILLPLGCLGLLTTSCMAPNDVVCTENLVYGLSVTVRDSVTGVPAGRQATAVAQDGSYTETLQFLGAFSPTDSLTFFGVAERAGTYQITVTKAGYQTWTRGGVQVLADVCHVHPAAVEVRLQPVQALR